jgi:hypothetical protein
VDLEQSLLDRAFARLRRHAPWAPGVEPSPLDTKSRTGEDSRREASQSALNP